MKIKTREMVIAAMMIALCGLAGLTSQYVYYNSVKLSFLFLPISVIGSCLTPIISVPAAVIGDFVNWYCKPVGAYFPGYGLSATLTVIVYAIFIYKKELKIWRVAIARAIVVILIDSVLNMFWGSIVTGKGISIIFIPRIVKSLIEYPIDVYLIYIFVKFSRRLINKTN